MSSLQSLTPEKIYQHLVQQWYILLLCLAISLVAAYIVNRYSTLFYRVSTSAVVRSSEDTNTAVSELLYGKELFGVKSIDLESEAYLLKSISNVKKTLTDLGFGISYHSTSQIKNTDLYPNEPIKLTLENSDFNKNRNLVITPVTESTYLLQFKQETGLKKILKSTSADIIIETQEFEYGKSYRIGEFSFIVYKKRDLLEPIIVNIRDYTRLAQNFKTMVSVSPLTPQSSILELSMEISNRAKGIDFLNKLVENYIDGELNRKNEAAVKTIDFINSQILVMSDSLEIVETKLKDFKTSNTQVTLSTTSTTYLETGQKFDAEKNRILLNIRYLDEVNNYIGSNNIEDIVIPSSIGITDIGLNNSIQELVELQLQIKTLKPSNPAYKNLRERIIILKSSVLENIRSLKVSNQLALENIDAQIGSLNSTLKDLPEMERNFVRIQRNYDLSENLYLFLMEKKAEAGIAKASNTVDYRVIDPAISSAGPVKPLPTLNYLIAIFMGLSLPSIIIVLRLVMNDKITSKEDLTKLSSIPYLGMIAKGKSGTGLATASQRRSILADSFRTVRSNLRYLVNDKRVNIFLITSFVSGEGKSFCSKNLSYTFSTFGKKVVMIDADMRKVSQYQEFGIETKMGLSDYLANLSGLDSVLYQTEFENLFIIPSGELPPNPTELLISGKFNALLNELKKSFDYIFIDTPPVGIIPDVLELMDQCDVVSFVVRQNYSKIKFLSEINDINKNKNLNPTLIFNGVNVGKIEGYNYYKKYYGRYSRHLNNGEKRSIGV